MLIIIAGAGEVGSHLSRLLSNENHEIILIDEDAEKLKSVGEHADIMTIVGYPTSYKHLTSASVNKADLFIAVSKFQEINISSALMAKQLGAKVTIARVDHHEFMNEENINYFKKIGIDHFIYPEGLGVTEILNSLKQTGIRQSMSFSNGKIFFSSIKIRTVAPIVGKKLQEITYKNASYTIVAIQRGSETIIPNGDTEIKIEDTLYIICLSDFLNEVKRLCGKVSYDINRIMILGGSRFAKKTATTLEKTHKIKIVEANEEKCIKLANRLEKTMIIHGDARNFELLKEEGLSQMDALIAVTNDSELNLLACVLAKNCGVKKVIAEIENNDYLQLAENLGIGTFINKKLIAASHLYGFTMKSKVANIKMIHAGNAEVLEFIVQEGAKITKCTLSHIDFPKIARIGGVIRDDEAFLVNGDTRIQANDRVIVFAMPQVVKQIEKFFNK